MFTRLGANQAFQRISGVASKAWAGTQKMGRGWAQDASKIWTGKYGGGGLKKA